MKSLNHIALFGLVSGLMVAGIAPSEAAPPANDNFANAESISGISGTVSGSNVDATVENDEPQPSFDVGGASVWWAWTAPQTGVFQFDNEGSGPDKNGDDFDSTVTVYTGTALDNLEELDSQELPVAFLAVSGQTYYISVTGQDLDGNGPDEGAIVLNWGLIPPGEISIFKETVRGSYYEHGVGEDTPPVPFASTETWTDTSYVVYDPTNARSVWVFTWTERVGRVTNKYYSYWAVSSFFPFEVIPGRLPGTAHWLSFNSGSFADNVAPSGNFLGDGRLGGSADQLAGLARPLVFGRAPTTVTITAPLAITGKNLWNGHQLTENGYHDEELDEWVADGFLTRSFYRGTGSTTQNLDTALTGGANLQDFTSEGLTYPKMTLENGLARVIALLKRSGYREFVDEEI